MAWRGWPCHAGRGLRQAGMALCRQATCCCAHTAERHVSHSGPPRPHPRPRRPGEKHNKDQVRTSKGTFMAASEDADGVLGWWAPAAPLAAAPVPWQPAPGTRSMCQHAPPWPLPGHCHGTPPPKCVVVPAPTAACLQAGGENCGSDAAAGAAWRGGRQLAVSVPAAGLRSAACSPDDIRLRPATLAPGRPLPWPAASLQLLAQCTLVTPPSLAARRASTCCSTKRGRITTAIMTILTLKVRRGWCADRGSRASIAPPPPPLDPPLLPPAQTLGRNPASALPRCWCT